jgi:hypothetical protein
MSDSTDIGQLGRRRDDVDIADIKYIRELEKRAQQRAEMRLEMAHAILLGEDNDEPLPMDHEAVELAGAFDGCITCEVREALDAAWPYLQRLAWSTCWCGGHRGPRTPADADGWGCLEDINHQGERPEDPSRHDQLAEAWREGWLTGNRWAFTEADVDDIGSNPHAS